MASIIRNFEYIIVLAFIISLGMATFSVATNISMEDTFVKVVSFNAFFN